MKQQEIQCVQCGNHTFSIITVSFYPRKNDNTVAHENITIALES